jgi:hypothetical protein
MSDTRLQAAAAPATTTSELLGAILERHDLRGNVEQLAENERHIERMVAACPEACRGCEGSVIEALIFVPHTAGLVELVAAASRQDITPQLLNHWCSEYYRNLSLPVKETLFRHFRGEDVTIRADLDEATMRMIVRTADANPHVRSIGLRGQGLTPRTIAELGQTTTLTSVSLTAVMHETSAVSKVALNASMAEAIRHNNTIEELHLHGDFDAFVCSGILNSNAALDSLHIHTMAGGGGGGHGDDNSLLQQHLSDNLEQVELMLKRNTALQDLSLGGDFTLTEDAATSLADGLKANIRLIALHCKFRHVDANGYKALVQVMANYNTSLEYFSGLGDALEYYGALNRAGRRVLRRQDTNHDTFLEVLHASIDNLSAIYGLLLDVPPDRWFS